MDGHPNPSSTPITTAEGEARRPRRKANLSSSNHTPADGGNARTTHGRPNPQPGFTNEARQQSGPRPRAPRPPKPQTFQLGPLDPLPREGQSAQHVARAAQRQAAGRKQFKVPASVRSAQAGTAAIGEDVGIPFMGGNGQPFDGQAAAAFLARNPGHLAGIYGATTDRRPGYLRAQNIPGNPRPQGSLAEIRPANRSAQSMNQSDSWRRPANEPHNPRFRPQVPASNAGYGRRPNPNPCRFNVANVTGTRFQHPATNMREVIEMLDRVPNPWPPATQPFPSAYRYTLTNPDPRSEIPPALLDPIRHSVLSTSILESWRASEPSKENKEAVVRILNQVNAIFQDRYGKRFRFVIEPFGSVSWGGETGDSADVDMMLKDFDRPFGYTKDLWPKNPKDRLDIGPIYNVYALARLLVEAGYIDVESVKFANTPIVKFKDPTSGVSLDLNTNDLGGEANSRMILAYCRLAPFTLRPLIHIVKTWAKSRNLNDSAGTHGSPTLSSYCWTLMCIAYMQVIGKLPNLQDAESVRAAGRENCVIWVSWGKPQGQAAEIGFAEPSAEDFATAGTSEEDIGELVKDFFTFYHNMLRKDEDPEWQPLAKHNGRRPHTRHHVISIWKGGLSERSVPVDSNPASRRQLDRQKEEARTRAIEDIESAQGDDAAMSGLEQNEQTSIAEDVENAHVQQQQQTPNSKEQPHGPKGRGRNRFLPAEEVQRGSLVDDFAQPIRWSKSDLVVQDPFLHDKNCASALSQPSFQRITKELERAVDILAGGEPLNALFAKPAARDMMSNRKKSRLQRQERQEQRIARSKATKAANKEKSSDSEYVASDDAAASRPITRSTRRG